jgi:cold shock CspA family protein
MPKGKSTVIGGSIRDVDQVRDRFVLNVYGEKPMRVLYDERTQVFRDGKRISLRDFGPTAHASIQTTLDGASIFAVSVHILSEQPSGDFQGRVKSFEPESGVLTLTTAASREPFRVKVTSQTAFKREGQSAFSSVASSANDLVPGSLVSVEFSSNNKGQGAAQEVTVLAAPGATFIFSGTLSSLDTHSGALTLVDARTNQGYQIFFDPTHQSAESLRAGQHVRISADYDGKRYVATEISVE